MAYKIEDIRKSQEIFYYLLEHHELREEEEQALYKAYTEEENVQNIVKTQGETAACDIERYGNTIYLIPREENNFLGYSRAELKKELCKSAGTNKDYYLAQFTILTLLTEFFDGEGNSSRAREYIRSGELMNILSERLREGAAYEEEHKEEEVDTAGISFSDMWHAYEALKSDEKSSRAKTTKEGFIYNLLLFLQRQGLIEYVERDEMIKTTKKLDSFMDWNLLNQNNYQRVKNVLGVIENEQN